jgi:hypothetical protein
MVWQRPESVLESQGTSFERIMMVFIIIIIPKVHTKSGYHSSFRLLFPKHNLYFYSVNPISSMDPRLPLNADAMQKPKPCHGMS